MPDVRNDEDVDVMKLMTERMFSTGKIYRLTAPK